MTDLMKKCLTFLLIIVTLFSSNTSKADEGMWLPMLVKRLNYETMKEMGLQLTAEEIYSVNNASLKDAIVSLGGFCTAEIISSEGLMLTNHHCGYDAIREQSTVENDYLTDGFWAMSRNRELPIIGLTASILVRMEDVTDKVLKGINDDTPEGQRRQMVNKNIQEIQAEAQEGNEYKIRIKDFFYGNEYYMFVYEVFEDVRLVGAPPSAIGKFGGDTDNWMWPRHTGDFSMFRIYANKDNQPAPFSMDNEPYEPKHHLPISLKGVEEDDFTMVFGFPGSTDRYLTSMGVKHAVEKEQPKRVEIRAKKLDIMKKRMKEDDAVRLQYASTYAQVSNYWKYFIGQSTQLKNNKVFEKKKKLEIKFQKWADDNDKKKYQGVVNEIEDALQMVQRNYLTDVYLQEAVFGSGVNVFYWRMNAELNQLVSEDTPEDKKEELKKSILKNGEEFFAEFDLQIERDIYEAMLGMYLRDVPSQQMNEEMLEIKKDLDGKVEKFVAKKFEKSILSNFENLKDFVEKPKAKTLSKDPLIPIFNAQLGSYFQNMQSTSSAGSRLEAAMRKFTAGLREMQPEKSFYPNANSSLRLTYGKVGDYKAKDAVQYDYYTTIEGIMEKEDPDDDEFIVPEKLKSLYEAKDFGRYTDKNGDLVICFISNNDITGGNSGSPVINAKGELIGCAFDGNWEAMSGDIYFEPVVQRTISMDARYILFIIDKYAGATHLIDEMTIVE